MRTTSPRRITQIAFATRDLDASLTYYSQNLGIGPWFVLPLVRFADTMFRGESCPAQVRVAFANSGGMEYEMVQQMDDTPSVWRDFLGDGPERERLHHFCERTHDFAAGERRLADEGYEAIMVGATPRGPFTYYAHPDAPGPYLELIEFTPPRKAMYDYFLLQGQNWDGQRPIRPMPPF